MGPWAVGLADTRPVAAALGLAVVAVVKLLGAGVPLLLAAGRLPGPRTWLLLCRAGGVVLVGYGGLNTVVAWLVLSGVVRPSDGYDRAAMVGHAALWDPLFLLWGVLLLLGLRRASAAPSRW